MGIGDAVIASGVARGAAKRGVRIAFGDGRLVRWDHNCEPILRGNPNVAFPGVHYERVEWVSHYKGARLYNRQLPDRWDWNRSFRVKPGEVFLQPDERLWAKRNFIRGSVIMEPTTAVKKGSYFVNKQWPFGRYQGVANALNAGGHQVYQFVMPGRPLLTNVIHIQAPDFRHALAVMERASLYVGTEGGLHHGAAAVGIPAVVLFGGWLPPEVLGYESHINLTGGEAEACGLFRPCEHCRTAMARISTAEVITAAFGFLEGGNDGGTERDGKAPASGAVSDAEG